MLVKRIKASKAAKAAAATEPPLTTTTVPTSNPRKLPASPGGDFE